MVQLQQGFAAGEMGFDLHFAWQQSLGPNVRFGSKADIGLATADVRFTPESGHYAAICSIDWGDHSGCES
jgi:hypothetical protein